MKSALGNQIDMSQIGKVRYKVPQLSVSHQNLNLPFQQKLKLGRSTKLHPFTSETQRSKSLSLLESERFKLLIVTGIVQDR